MFDCFPETTPVSYKEKRNKLSDMKLHNFT